MTRILFRLFRLRLVLMNGVAALGGYFLFPGSPEALPLVALCAGVSLLACGGSALNQVLERDLDCLMERTRNRPLPTGELRPGTAALLGGGCLLAGVLLLVAAGGVFPGLLGAAAISW